MRQNGLFIFLIVFTLFGVSCTEEMLKSDYDYKTDPSKLPTSELTITGLTGASVSCMANLNFVDTNKEYLEKGFVCAKDVDFTEGVISITVKSKIFSGTLIGLDELTDYFVKAYIITKDGIAYSDFQLITTPVFINPLLHLCGTYIESDFLFEDGSLEDNYYVKLSPIKSNPIQLEMTNFWGGGEAIIVDVDLSTKRLTIAPQTIYVDDTYGNVTGYPLSKQGVDKTGNPIVGTIGLTGVITFTGWAATVEDGNFGVYSSSVLEPATSQFVGTYVERDYVYPVDTIEATDNDTVRITTVAGVLNRISISNFWKKGLTGEIFATVDFDKMELTIPSQKLYTHSLYGDYILKPLNIQTGTFTSGDIKGVLTEDGTITLSAWTLIGSENLHNAYTKSTLKIKDQLLIKRQLKKATSKSIK